MTIYFILEQEVGDSLQVTLEREGEVSPAAEGEAPPNPKATAITSIALNGTGKVSTLVVAYGSGGLNAHTLSQRFAQVEEGELESLVSFLEDTV